MGQKLKSHSAKWMKMQSENLKNFYWQNGYESFSVNPADVDKLLAYIDNLKVHHERKTFQDEYRGFLTKYKVDFDERHVWD